MPKLTIAKENFNDVDAYTGKVYLRYRIVSEDRNRSSYWSPVFEFETPAYYVQGTLNIPGNIIGIKNTDYITLAWNSVSIYSNSDLSYWGELPSYDIWIQYGGNNMVNAGPWLYKERIFTTSVNLVIPPTYNYVDSNGDTQVGTTRQAKIEVHRTVNPISRYSPDRFIFSQSSLGVDLNNDIITSIDPHNVETGDMVAYYVYNSASSIPPLSDGDFFWARNISPNQISLHASEAGAVNNTDKVDLTGYGQGAGVVVRNPFLQSTAIDTSTSVITLPYEHNFRVGESVIYNAESAASPLIKETLYWVRPISTFQVALYNSRTEAIKDENRINLSNTGAGYGTLPRFLSLLYKVSVINL